MQKSRLKFIYLLIFFFTTTDIQAQQEEKKERLPDKEKTSEPSFPGGISELKKFLSENVYSYIFSRYREECISGKIIIRFVVEKDGSLTNFEIMKGIYPCMDKDVLRILETMPNWIPGKDNGVEVRKYYILPIVYNIN